MLSFEEIKELIALVAENRMSGLELERSGFRLKIDGYQPATEATPAAHVAASQAAAAPPPPAAPAPAASAPQAPAPGETPAESGAETDEDELPEGAHVVHSPIVGTFYRKPKPDADPFVRTGDEVDEGQVLCIVEAMKLMNEIESDVEGKVIKIFPKDAQAVEYGEELFAIMPS